MLPSAGRLELRRPPSIRPSQPDGQIRARPAEVERIEQPLVEERRPCNQMLDVRPPGGDWVRLVEAYGLRHVLPEALDIGLPEDLFGPALSGIRGDRPVHPSLLEGELQASLRELLGSRLADAGAVQVGEDVGIRIAGNRDLGPADAGEILQLLELPGRRPLEQLIRAVDDQFPLHVLVGVAGRDVACACLVRSGRKRPDERRVLHVTADHDILALADVGADPNDEIRVSPEEIHLSHEAIVGSS